MKPLWIKRGIVGSGDDSKNLTDGIEGNGQVDCKAHPSLEGSKQKFFL